MNYLPERDFIVLLLGKNEFNLFFEFLDLGYIKDNYRELSYIYLALKECHTATDKDITLSELQAWFFHKYPSLEKGIYLPLFESLSETQINPDLGLALLKQIKARKQALKLSEAAFKFSSGTGEVDDIAKEYERFSGNQSDVKEEFEFVTTDLSIIVADLFGTPGMRWRLDSLNKSLGSLRKGNFGFIFARPETGKTTFLASEVTHFLDQLGEEDGPIIWFNNEQPGREVMLRVIQSYFGITMEALLASSGRYAEQFKHATGNKFLLVDDANIEKSEVERILKRFNPSLVVFDQTDKIKGFVDDREDLRLGNIYIWARELAKKYCPIIGVCQADGSGDGQKWLTMNNVANAKTSKQAEADWILGIGHSFGEGQQFIRYLNISKNKLLGDSDTLAKMRHGRMEVLIEPEIARYKDLIAYA
jgi:replicative DNA helicase